MAEEQSDVYRGSCHCGALQFTAEKKGTPEKVIECNCSYCSRTGFQYGSSLPVGEVKMTSNWDKYIDYQFGEKKYTHRFCSTCGSSIAVLNADGKIATVNARMMMADIKPRSLPVKVYNGAVEQKGYDPEPPKAPEPQPDGKLLYHGSCHCRAVTYEVIFPPITSVNQCGCSICWRLLSGEESLFKYQFNTMKASHMTCKACGVSLFNFLYPESPLAPLNGLISTLAFI
ncbi:hypothetical protein NA57DRAFT_60571 [Rhizodiscina lignyota]|uniref:CENP-V/GFA domain-containing protein n=1 Tax=Rhizodiscina lignyota TaxID=1504668 RepID=A0A9P4I7G5_9PEZI|nr:hypothetical protein NA57DRAFT_60571 [Rhizodiscina lignyota]